MFLVEAFVSYIIRAKFMQLIVTVCSKIGFIGNLYFQMDTNMKKHNVTIFIRGGERKTVINMARNIYEKGSGNQSEQVYSSQKVL